MHGELRSRSRKWGRLTGAIGALALLLAACGGGDETQVAVGDDLPGATDDDDDELSQELAAFAERWSETEAKVTYSMSVGEAGEQELAGEMTIAWRPPGHWRFDLDFDAQQATVISAGEAAVFCQHQEQMCMSAPGLEEAMPVPFFGLFTDPLQLRQTALGLGAAGVERSSRDLLGEPAACFSARAGGEVGGLAELCFSSDGIMLLLEGRERDAEGGVSRFSMVAESLSRAVSDADFAPPYPVQEFEMPAGGFGGPDPGY